MSNKMCPIEELNLRECEEASALAPTPLYIYLRKAPTFISFTGRKAC